jgi:hypothetical protein
MAIALEFLNFIVPISVIRAKYPGGWEQCLQDHKKLIGGRVWYDSYLFRDGAMNSFDIGLLVEHWSSLGFAPLASEQDQTVWNDVCVVEAMTGGSTLPCKWLEINESDGTAHYNGTKSNVVASRASFDNGRAKR